MKSAIPHVYEVQKAGKTYQFVRIQHRKRRGQAPFTNDWLVAHGGRATNDPVRRAHAIRARLLQQLAEVDVASERARLSATVTAYLDALEALPRSRQPSEEHKARRRAVLLKGTSRRLALVAFLDDPVTSEVRTADILRFERHLEDAGYAPETIRAFLKDTHAFFRWAVHEKRLVEDPMAPAIYRMPAGGSLEERNRGYTVEELLALRTALQDGWPLLYRTFLILTQTGVRRGEFLKLQAKMVRGGFIKVPGARKGAHREAGSKWREVPVTGELARLLDSAALRPESFLASGTLSPLCERKLRRRYKRFNEETGLHFQPQRFRRAYGQRLVDAGLPIHVVCERMGNSPAILRRWYVFPPQVPLSSLEEQALRLPEEANRDAGDGS